LKIDEIEQLSKRYIDDSIDCLKQLKGQIRTLRRIMELMLDTRLRGGNIFIIGNGGSSSTASHMACDLNKTSIRAGVSRFRAIALTDNTPLLTAWSNDQSYADIFVEQLRNFLEKGDLLVAFSGSGKSENVIRALRFAREAGAMTVGLTGFQGGLMKDLADICLIVDSDVMYRIEDVHLMINHLVTYVMLNTKVRSTNSDKIVQR